MTKTSRSVAATICKRRIHRHGPGDRMERTARPVSGMVSRNASTMIIDRRVQEQATSEIDGMGGGSGRSYGGAPIASRLTPGPSRNLLLKKPTSQWAE